MGGLLSNTARVMKTYNIEERAHKALSENRKVVPPKHPSTVSHLEKIRVDYASKFEELSKKDEYLDTNLKSVYVKSVPGAEAFPRNLDLLPKRTRYESPFEYGYMDPETAPPGRYTLTKIIQVLTEYHKDREENSVKKLALKHNIDENHLNSIVQYYKLFKLGRRADKTRTIVGTRWSKDREWSKGEEIGLKNIKRIPQGQDKGAKARQTTKKLSSGEEKET